MNLPDVKETIMGIQSFGKPRVNVGKPSSTTASTAESTSSIPETIDERNLGPNDPTVAGQFYFGKDGAMYAKDLPPEKPKEEEDDNPMAKGPGRFVYRDGKLVWSRDDLRHIEG